MPAGRPSLRRSMAATWALGLLVAAATLLPASPASPATPTSPTYYVSVGDSYAIGYQPDPTLSLRHGYTATVLALERQRGTALTLVNFGCGGATTTSMLVTKGCPVVALHGPRYPATPQATAALRFIAAHRGHIGLITVSIGGNDITACTLSASLSACAPKVVPTMAANITKLVKELHAAAGATVPIVGTSYPDIVLAAWVDQPTNQAAAKASVSVSRLIVDPALQRAYNDNGGTFVDVTAASGAYTPLSRTVTLKPYGKVPVAVADVCRLTWGCALIDVHPRTAGYQLIGQLIVAALPKQLP
jgi:lysophospholipase L1-like esterase